MPVTLIDGRDFGRIHGTAFRAMVPGGVFFLFFFGLLVCFL